MVWTRGGGGGREGPGGPERGVGRRVGGQSPSFLVPALLIPYSSHRSLTRASLQPPAPFWLSPPPPPTQSSYSQSGRTERTRGAPSVQLNAPLLLPRGAQAWMSQWEVLMSAARSPGTSTGQPGAQSPDVRARPSHWSGLPEVSGLELKGNNSTQTDIQTSHPKLRR